MVYTYNEDGKGKINSEGVSAFDLFMKEKDNEPNLYDYTSIKTYEDACEALGELPINHLEIEYGDISNYYSSPFPKHIIALMKLETISKALRGNWKPDKNDTGFLPVFNNKLFNNKKGELVVNKYAAIICTDDMRFYNYNLYQKSVETAKYFGEQFIDLWNDYFIR